jgi:hypothetical protein
MEGEVGRGEKTWSLRRGIDWLQGLLPLSSVDFSYTYWEFLEIFLLEQSDISIYVQVKLLPTVRRQASLAVRRPSGIRDQFLFPFKISFRQLRVCYSYFIAVSLTRGRVCNLLFLLVIVSAVPRDSRPYFIVTILKTPPTWRVRSP